LVYFNDDIDDLAPSLGYFISVDERHLDVPCLILLTHLLGHFIVGGEPVIEAAFFFGELAAPAEHVERAVAGAQAEAALPLETGVQRLGQVRLEAVGRLLAAVPVRVRELRPLVAVAQRTIGSGVGVDEVEDLERDVIVF
jgi:hypothetical protein